MFEPLAMLIENDPALMFTADDVLNSIPAAAMLLPSETL